MHRLLAAGLLSTRTVIDGSLRVSQLSGRNLNLAVTTRDGPSYVVKYNCVGGSCREAAAYELLAAVAGPEVRAVLPSVVADTPQDAMLVLEHVGGSDLRHHHARIGRCPSSWARRSGTLLAAVHDVPISAVPATLRRGYVPAVHRPDESLFATRSRAAIELTVLIQSDPALCAALDELAADHTADAFVHGDIRWPNLLVARDPGGRPTGLRLVDWESAGVGDPDWDIGCLLAEYVSHWIDSVPLTSAATAAADAALARVPLAATQAAIAAAWSGYLARRGAERVDGSTLQRVTRHAAHRLLHRALEIDQVSPDVSLAAVCHVQVGARMLADPDAASTQLLGLRNAGIADG